VRVLVTGAGGMLGSAVIPTLQNHDHLVMATDHHSLPSGLFGGSATRRTLDVAERLRFRQVMHEFRPDWILHCAAFTHVDLCELNPQDAYRANVLGVVHAAMLARAYRAKLLFLSSDYVFDGRVFRPYIESDRPRPLSAYGRMKFLAEQRIAGILPRDHLIVRTAWLYGEGGRNFVDTILLKARAGESLRVVDDQRGCPTWTQDLAGALEFLLRRNYRGTIHAANTGSCTWYGLAQEACRMAGLHVEIAPATTAEVGRPAPRPAYSVLDTTLLSALGYQMPDWRNALSRYIAQLALLKG
jgi:dTDP-4-dehydrorhamnose reductase